MPYLGQSRASEGTLKTHIAASSVPRVRNREKRWRRRRATFASARKRPQPSKHLELPAVHLSSDDHLPIIWTSQTKALEEGAE